MMKSTTQTRLSLQSNFAISDFPAAQPAVCYMSSPPIHLFEMLLVWNPCSLPLRNRSGSNPTRLKNENSGIKGKQSYFDCIVPPAVGETDNTVAAAQARAALATQINN